MKASFEMEETLAHRREGTGPRYEVCDGRWLYVPLVPVSEGGRDHIRCDPYLWPPRSSHVRGNVRPG
jgi:hypothetical protein